MKLTFGVARAGSGERVVALEGAGKHYGRRWVLDGVDLEVAGGAVVHVRGANGAGKSTLLRVLAGVSPPDRGRRLGPARAGYAPDGLPAPPAMTVAAYLRAHARMRGLGGARIARGRETAAGRETGGGGGEPAVLAARLGFSELLGERMTVLSKGSRQKVVVAQALLGAPALLVLDEPFSGLDRAAVAALAEVLDERVAEGAAVVLADHGTA